MMSRFLLAILCAAIAVAQEPRIEPVRYPIKLPAIALSSLGVPPVIAANTGITVVQADTATITSTNLLANDPDTSPENLTYTITSAPTHCSVLLSGVATTVFTQADINNNLVELVHDGTENFSDSLTLSLSDGLNTLNVQESITVTPVFYERIYDGGDRDTTTTIVSTSSQGTIMAWVNVDPTLPSRGVIWGMGRLDKGFKMHPRCYRYNTKFAVEFEYRFDVTGQLYTITSDTSYNVGEWYHVAVTSNGTSWSIFVNGVATPIYIITGGHNGYWFDDVDIANPIASIGAVIYISGWGGYFKGKIADVRIYDTALTQEQIAAAMVQTRPTGTRAHWPLMPGSGTTIMDISGNDIHMYSAPAPASPTWGARYTSLVGGPN